jgi:hypothetical protein
MDLLYKLITLSFRSVVNFSTSTAIEHYSNARLYQFCLFAALALGKSESHLAIATNIFQNLFKAFSF